MGEDFYDLCRGPHVENTKYLRGFAYKFNRVSGAYWKGDEHNKMLQRAYVYGFLDKKYSQKEIGEYLNIPQYKVSRIINIVISKMKKAIM